MAETLVMALAVMTALAVGLWLMVSVTEVLLASLRRARL